MRIIASEFPLFSCRKTRAPPPSQVGLFHLFYHLLRGQLTKGFHQGRITTDCEIVLDARRIDLDIIADEVTPLMLVERDLRLTGYLLIVVGAGDDIEQPIDDLLCDNGLRNNFLCIARLHLKITGLLRIDDNEGASLTKAGATCFPDIHFLFQSLFFELLFESGHDICRAESEAARPGAYSDARLIRILF
jgi:hypothetical protein